MLISKPVLALSAFHFALTTVVLVAVFSAVVFIGGNIRPDLTAVMLAYLALIVWWATGRARSTLEDHPPSRIDAFITTGVRWGAVAGVLYWLGLIAIWIAAGAVYVLFFEPESVDYDMIGGRYAFVLLPLMAVVPGGLIAASVGAALGGSIAIVDRTLLAVAHWSGRSLSSR